MLPIFTQPDLARVRAACSASYLHRLPVSTTARASIHYHAVKNIREFATRLSKFCNIRKRGCAGGPCVVDSLVTLSRRELAGTQRRVPALTARALVAPPYS